MQRFSLIAALAIATLVSTTSAAPNVNDLRGTWNGAVVRLNSITQLQVDFDPQGGKVAGTFNLPELGLFEKPIDTTDFSDGQFGLKILYGLFTCKYHEDVDEITCENKKWNPPVGAHLKRSPLTTPRFRREPVNFTSAHNRIAGTIFLPNSPGPHPGVVLVHGSGQGGRDEWTYTGYAHILANAGIAALAYDKRGYGESAGDADKNTFDDLMADAASAVRFLKSRPEIRSDQVGLMGGSQGGWIGLGAASQEPSAAFLIMRVGPAVTVWEQERHRVEYTMRSENVSDEDIRHALELTDHIFDFADSQKGWDQLEKQVGAARGQKWAGHVQLPESAEDALSWRQQRFDPAPMLKKLKIPLLALYAEDDVYVPPKENVDKLRRYLDEAGNKDATIKVFKTGGHGMEPFADLRGGDWDWPDKYWVWPRKTPGLYTTLIDWIADHTGEKNAQSAGS